MHKIVLAPVGKRALAAVIDLILALFIWLGVFAGAQAIFLSVDYSKNLASEMTSYQVASGLYYLGTDGNVAAHDDYVAYESYQGMVVSYYTDYLVNKCPEEYRNAKYTTYWYNVFILGQDDPKSLYTSEALSSRESPSKTDGPTYFEYDGANYDSLAIPKSDLYVDGDRAKGLSDDGKKELLAFYYSPSHQSAYFNAGNSLFQMPFYSEPNAAYSAMEKTYPLLVGIAISYSLYYLSVPLIFKDGETFGKRMFGLCLVNKNGFQVQKPQVVIRTLPLALIMLALFFFLGNIYGIMFTLFILMVSYILVIFTKDHEAIHDFMALTYVVDKRDSVFFNNIEEQDRQEKAYSAAMMEADKIRESVNIAPVDSKTPDVSSEDK